MFETFYRIHKILLNYDYSIKFSMWVYNISSFLYPIPKINYPFYYGKNEDIFTLLSDSIPVFEFYIYYSFEVSLDSNNHFLEIEILLINENLYTK